MFHPNTEKLVQDLQVALEASTIFTVPPHYERWEDGFKSLDSARRAIGEIKVRLEHSKDAPSWLLSDVAQVHGQLNDFVSLRDDFYRQFPKGGDSHAWTSLKAAERALEDLQRSVSTLRNNIRTRVGRDGNEGIPRKTQQILAFAFGVAFVIALLLLAIFIREPTPFQYTTFKVVLALAAAGVAAMIPGFLYVTVKDWIRAGGAMAVFVIVFFNNPAALVISAPQEPDPTAAFSIVLACKVDSTMTVDTYTFPFGDVKKADDSTGIAQLIEKLPNQRCKQDGASIFRVKDEILLGDINSPSATAGGNLGVIVIPPAIVQELGGNHLAFTKINSSRSQH